MKRIAILYTLLAAIMLGTASFTLLPEKKEKKIEWLTIEEAYIKNKKKNRKIFVDVYTDWCGWCKHMDKNTFADAAVIDYVNDNYYAVKLDAESTAKMKIGEFETTEQDIARAFKVSSYPTIVFIKEDFKTITPLAGYRDAKSFLDILKAFEADKLQVDR